MVWIYISLLIPWKDLLFTGTGETPSFGTLDTYLSRLSSALESSPHEHRTLLLKLQDLLAHLDR